MNSEQDCRDHVKGGCRSWHVPLLGNFVMLMQSPECKQVLIAEHSLFWGTLLMFGCATGVRGEPEQDAAHHRHPSRQQRQVASVPRRLPQRQKCVFMTSLCRAVVSVVEWSVRHVHAADMPANAWSSTLPVLVHCIQSWLEMLTKLHPQQAPAIWLRCVTCYAFLQATSSLRRRRRSL